MLLRVLATVTAAVMAAAILQRRALTHDPRQWLAALWKRSRPRPRLRSPFGHLLPKAIHRIATVESGQLNRDGRLVIVGDVHGCNEELQRLLATVQYQPGRDNLLFVGDLVNKGPESPAVLDTFIKFNGLGVRGNHDDAVLHTYHDFRDGKQLKPGREWASELQPRHVRVLEDLPFTLSLPEFGIILVHAGLVPGLPLEDQDPWSMYKMRNLAPAPEAAAGLAAATAGSSSFVALEKDRDGGTAWAHVWPGPQHVFFGHDAVRSLQLAPCATGLDTACVYGRMLSAAIVPPLDELAEPRGDPENGDDFRGEVISGRLAAKLAAGSPISRQDLGVRIVSVPAQKVHSAPGGK